MHAATQLCLMPSGALHEATGNHNTGFYFAGASVLIAGMLLFLLKGATHQGEIEKEESQDDYSKMLQSTFNIQSTILMQLASPTSRCERQNSITAMTKF